MSNMMQQGNPLVQKLNLKVKEDADEIDRLRSALSEAEKGRDYAIRWANKAVEDVKASYEAELAKANDNARITNELLTAAVEDYNGALAELEKAKNPSNEYGNLAENAEYISVQNSRIEMLEAKLAQARKALEPFALFFKSEMHDLSPASDATIFAAFNDQDTGAPLADLSIADVRRAHALIADTVRTEGEQK